MTREDLRNLAEENHMTEDEAIDAILASIKVPFVSACIRLEDAKRQMVEAML